MSAEAPHRRRTAESPTRFPVLLPPLSLVSLVSVLLLGAAEPPVPAPAGPTPPAAGATASDLEIVALQTTGPGRIGDCNAVVARLRNAGTAATAEAPAVRLDVAGGTRWTRTVRAGAPLEPGDTVEVWFESVPLEGGRLSQLEATADPDRREPESNETNNGRRVPRDPQVACGAPERATAAGLELRVLVVGGGGAAAGEASAIGAAEVTVTSPLGGAPLASGVTAGDGRTILTVPADPRSPLLKVTASAPGCPAVVRLATPSAGATEPLDVTIELTCANVAAAGPTDQEAGVLEIETALPGRLSLDDGPGEIVTFGSRVMVRRPGASVRVRASSANGTVFHDQALEVPRTGRRTVTIDAPALQSAPGEIVEDLRSGLWWTIGAPSTASFAEAAAICDGLERGGSDDWRLPEIDQLAFVMEARSRIAAGAGAPLQALAGCCVWSSTEHAGLRLTFYLEGGHLYGRRAEEGGIGALCVRGMPYEVDPLRVPDRYQDRLPGRRSFRPRE